MKKILLYLAIFTGIISFYSCESSLKPARGEEDEIIVIADSLEYESFRHSLESSFEKVVYTPQPEKLYSLKRVSYSELERYKLRKNLIIIAPINSGTSVSRYISSIIDSTVKEKVLKKEISFIFKYDFWAKGQIVILITAPVIEEMEYAVLNHSDKFLYNIQKLSDKRLKESFYNSRYENSELEAHFVKNYGWFLFTQVDYVLAVDKPKDNFVWLRRSPDTDMERWIFVHWIENASPLYLNKDSIISIRNRMTEKYYRTSDDRYYVQIADSGFTPSEINFEGRYALFVQGFWQMTDKFMGGPFMSYSFYDEKTKRFYMVDGSLYAPKYFKRKIMQQIDIILQSFKTKDQLSKEYLEEL